MLTIISLLLLAVILIWTLFLTLIIRKINISFNKLVDGSGKLGLRGLLEDILKSQAQNKKDIEILSSMCAKIEQEGHFHIQKVGLYRFNPFKDTGGDQSFILSLVDKNDTGVIISGLYSRSGLRWYAKRVINGKSVEHELSDDEKKALKEAGDIKKS